MRLITLHLLLSTLLLGEGLPARAADDKAPAAASENSEEPRPASGKQPKGRWAKMKSKWNETQKKLKEEEEKRKKEEEAKKKK